MRGGKKWKHPSRAGHSATTEKAGTMTRRKIRAMTWYLLIAVLVAGGLSFGQDPRGTILGRVQDQTGAVVPNVAVRVTHVATGVSATATTNQSGNFNIP